METQLLNLHHASSSWNDSTRFGSLKSRNTVSLFLTLIHPSWFISSTIPRNASIWSCINLPIIIRNHQTWNIRRRPCIITLYFTKRGVQCFNKINETWFNQAWFYFTWRFDSVDPDWVEWIPCFVSLCFLFPLALFFYRYRYRYRYGYCYGYGFGYGWCREDIVRSCISTCLSIIPALSSILTTECKFESGVMKKIHVWMYNLATTLSQILYQCGLCDFCGWKEQIQFDKFLNRLVDQSQVVLGTPP